MTESKVTEEKPKLTDYEPVTRENLIKKRGHMVDCLYIENGLTCFAIGWFFQLTQNTVRLKVTSTRFENYESLDIPVDTIFQMGDYFD